MATPIDFDTLTPEQLDSLTGYAREAYYAHRVGDAEKVAEIFASYPDGVVFQRSEENAPDVPSGEPVVVAEAPVAEVDPLSPEAQVAKRAAAAEAKRAADLDALAAAQAAVATDELPPPPAEAV